ncbi:MAG: hypothetical protein ABSB19_18845 [Methylomonas sp.]
MKLYTLFSALLLAVCCLYSPNNWAWGHGGRFGVYIGAPFYGGYYGYGYGYPYAYPYGYPYYPPAVAAVPAPMAPQTYIQQSPSVVQPPPPAVQQQPQQGSYWHFCSDPEGYYPYIKECPGGWQLVQPSPH